MNPGLRLVVTTTSLILLASCAHSGSSGASVAGASAAPASPVQLATPSVPLLPGSETSNLTGANKALSFSVLVANDKPASPDTLNRVWLDQTTDSVALEYSGGDVNMVESPVAYEDANSYFESIIKDGGATEALTTVQGYPALAIEGKTDVFDSNPSWLGIDFNGVNVNISSTAYPVDLDRDRCLFKRVSSLTASVPSTLQALEVRWASGGHRTNFIGQQ